MVIERTVHDGGERGDSTKKEVIFDGFTLFRMPLVSSASCM
jgi:hypothetical protein